MKVKWNVVGQALALVLQGLNYASGVVPVKYQIWVSFGIGVVQASMALVAHFSNPDGTPAAQPYIKGGTK